MFDNDLDVILSAKDIKICLWEGFEAPPASDDRQVYLHKDRRFLSALTAAIDKTKPRRMIEIGVFHGGSAIYWTERYALERLTTFDVASEAPVLTNYVNRHGLSGMVHTHFGVSQDNAAKLQEAVVADFGNDLVDVLIDDASHLYDPTRASLEILLPYVRPGGAYVIEDWAWPPLFPIMGELPMLLWEPADAIARIEIDKNFVVLWRGDGPLPRDGSFKLRGP